MSDEALSAGDQTSWKGILVKAAEESFGASEKGVLLSRVPTLLRQNGIEPSELFRTYKVRYFLETFGAPEISLIQNEENPALWIVIPGGVKLDKPPSTYFPESSGHVSAKVPRFKPSVWKAFVTALPTGFQRWIHLQPRVIFVDLPEHERSEATLIEREFVRTDDLFLENVEVTSRIERWAARHGIPLSDLAYRTEAQVADRGRSLNENPLKNFLNELSADERQRLLIPSDIIQKFL